MWRHPRPWRVCEIGHGLGGAPAPDAQKGAIPLSANGCRSVTPHIADAYVNHRVRQSRCLNVGLHAAPLPRRRERSDGMTIKQVLGASTLAAGIGVAGLLGVGLGTAGADPGHDCYRPGVCDGRHDGRDFHDGHDGGPVDWHNRGVDEGRRDHRPFNWNGRQVYPIPAGNGLGWGFWFGPIWIPL